MSDIDFIGAIYLLGFIGLVSIGLIPFRSWVVFNMEMYRARSAGWGMSIIPIVIVSAVAWWADITVSGRIFACLTKGYCGPSIASGWIYLAYLGSVYLIFEAVITLLRRRAA